MIDIERWKPERWDQIVGNQELKEFFWDMIWCVRKEGHRSGFNLLLTGPSRGGKTSGIVFGLQSLFCLNFDLDTMNPCGQCRNCTMKVHLYGNDGWEDFIDYLEPEDEDWLEHHGVRDSLVLVARTCPNNPVRMLWILKQRLGSP